MSCMLPVIIAFTIAVFILALISPRLSRKVEHKTVRHATKLKRRSNSLWTPLTFLSKGALGILSKLVKVSTKSGRKIRKKTDGTDT